MRSPRDVAKIAAKIGSAALVLAALGSEVRAEVAAEVDAFGKYLRTVVVSSASAKNMKIWAPQRPRVWGRFPLNGSGDLNGDLWPVIVENPVEGNHPWVLWSRFSAADFDMAWSRWSNGAWTAVAWLDPGGPTPGDDLDPHVALDRNPPLLVQMVLWVYVVPELLP